MELSTSRLAATAGHRALRWLVVGACFTWAAAWGQISLVRVTNCGPATFPGACAVPATGSGNLIVVGWQTGGGANLGTTISSITDNAGNLYAQAGPVRALDVGVGSVSDIWYAKDSLAGATSITVTPSEATTNTGVVIWEFSGVDRTAPLGTTAIRNSQAATTAPIGGPVTTTASSVVISLAAVARTVTGIAPGNPFTNVSTLKANGWAHLIAPSPGAYSAQWTQDPAGSYCSSTVWFRAAGGTPSSACDLNADGTVNSSDVNLMVNMVLGSAACTANITGPGVCNVSTVQRVVNASLPGGSCVTSTSGYSISGTISPAASGSGSTLALSGAASASTTADASGAFTFSGLANGSYTITPSKTGYTFTPASQPVTVSGANVTGVAFSISQDPPVSHSVTLTWGASPTAGVVGYNIYRSQTSGGPYARINSSAISGLTYVDTTVAGGLTYYYVATAVNGSGQESPYSPQAQAVIPSP
jgi:hypothetical protein